MATCEATVYDRIYGNRPCKHRGSSDIDGRWYCRRHDPRSEAMSDDGRRDREEADIMTVLAFERHNVTNREIRNGILDRALTMLRASEVQ